MILLFTYLLTWRIKLVEEYIFLELERYNHTQDATQTIQKPTQITNMHINNIATIPIS